MECDVREMAVAGGGMLLSAVHSRGGGRLVWVSFRHDNGQLSGAGRGTIIPGLLRRIPSELRS